MLSGPRRAQAREQVARRIGPIPEYPGRKHLRVPASGRPTLDRSDRHLRAARPTAFDLEVQEPRGHEKPVWDDENGPYRNPTQVC